MRPQLPMLVRELLPSPTAKDAPRSNGFMGPALAEAVRDLLPTPTASDAKNRRTSETAKRTWSSGPSLTDVFVGPPTSLGDATSQPSNDTSGCSDAPAPWPVIDGTRSLDGDFTAWMMGMPVGWLDGISNTAKKRLCGNAVVSAQAEAALRELVRR